MIIWKLGAARIAVVDLGLLGEATDMDPGDVV